VVGPAWMGGVKGVWGRAKEGVKLTWPEELGPFLLWLICEVYCDDGDGDENPP